MPSSLQGNGLYFDRVTEADTGIYTCYLDNFVQPVVSYKFSLMVEGKLTELRFYVPLDTKQALSETFFPANLLP